MSLLEGLMQNLSGPALSMISQQIGADEGQTQSALSGALPLIISAMAKNAASPEGANSLSNALDQHNGGILENLAGFIPNALAGEGAGILKHVLGNKQPLAEQGISQASGLSAAQVGQLLVTVAPIVMGYLGKQKQETGLDASSIAGLLGGQQAQAQSHAAGGGMGMLMNLLDMDNDGSPVDDVLGMLGKFMK